MSAIDANQPDDLADVGPYGMLTSKGWATVPLDCRARAIVTESQLRVAGAAEVILSMCVHMEETRKAALLFVAHSLRDTARILERAQQAEKTAAIAAEEAEEAPSKKRPKRRKGDST